MSNEEITKWQNKLKLWVKLHPEEMIKRGKQTVVARSICEKVSCPYYTEGNHTCRTMPQALGLLGDFSTIQCVPFKVIQESGVFMGCVEWIKYV